MSSLRSSLKSTSFLDTLRLSVNLGLDYKLLYFPRGVRNSLSAMLSPCALAYPGIEFPTSSGIGRSQADRGEENHSHIYEGDFWEMHWPQDWPVCSLLYPQRLERRSASQHRGAVRTFLLVKWTCPCESEGAGQGGLSRTTPEALTSLQTWRMRMEMPS